MEASVRNGWYTLLGWCVKVYLRLHGCNVGSRFRCMGLPVFRAVPKSNIFIGNNVTLGHGVVLEVTPTGQLTLDNYVIIGDYCTISAAHSIHLHPWCGIAERVSLRDSFHQMSPDKLYRLQPSKGRPITLGEDTGVGAGGVVLEGVQLPKGAFIGANAVVSRHDALEEYGIYAGNPLKLVRKR